MRELDGKVAVVTGGASGIGLALSERFATEGMKVVVADVEETALDKAVARLTEARRGGDRRPHRRHLVRVGRRAGRRGLRRAYGAVHVLCNNAGVGPPGGLVWESTPNDWKWTFGVNVFGVAHGIQAFVPRMIEGGRGGPRDQHLVDRRPDRADAAGVGLRVEQVRGHLPHRVPRRRSSRPRAPR